MTTFLSPTNDIAFKKIFGEIKNKDILIHFLNDVLHKQDESAISDLLITCLFSWTLTTEQSTYAYLGYDYI